jgi:lipopolysaccharide export system permease protein
VFRIQTYVLTRTMAGVLASLSVVAAVVSLVDFVELSRSVGAKADAGFLTLIGLVALEAPSVLLVLAPFVFLFGGMGAFVALNRRNELIAMRAAGVSAWRFVLPAAAAAAMVGVLAVCVLNPAAAQMMAAYQDRRAELDEGAGVGRGDLWLRQGDGARQTVIHARAHDSEGGAIALHGVSMFVEETAPDGALRFRRRIDARRAILTPGYWRLSGVREVAPGEGAIASEQLSMPSTLDRRTAMEKFVPAGAVSFWDLADTIRSARAAGYSATAYQLRQQQLFALPLLLAAMTVLAASFCLRLNRLGDLALLAASGIALGFGFFFLNQFCGALGSTGVIPIGLAAWAPPLLALLAGLTLLTWTEDG